MKLFTQEQKKHHSKWLDIAKKYNITCPPLSTFGVENLAELLELYKQDENMNNIPLLKFDALYYSLPPMPGEGKAPYFSACIYKALLRQLLFDKGLLNNEIAKDNRYTLSIEEAKKINNLLDCDVIQNAITEAKKNQDNKTDDQKIDALEYLRTSILYRTKDKTMIRYFIKLIDEFIELTKE